MNTHLARSDEEIATVAEKHLHEYLKSAEFLQSAPPQAKLYFGCQNEACGERLLAPVSDPELAFCNVLCRDTHRLEVMRRARLADIIARIDADDMRLLLRELVGHIPTSDDVSMSDVFHAMVDAAARLR